MGVTKSFYREALNIVFPQCFQNSMWILSELDLDKAWPLYGSLMFSLLFWRGFDVVF